MKLDLQKNIGLAGKTTFGVGGPASFFVRCENLEAVRAALVWAKEQQLPTFVLGGGSNLLVADRGFAGLVLQLGEDGITAREDGAEIVLEAAGGAGWDAVVQAALAAGGAGLEALSGIPGLAGAAPIQNIGAYGQEVAGQLEEVSVLDRESLEEKILPAAACGFGYRTSFFKTRWAGRYLITRIGFRLPRRDTAPAGYAELRRHLGLLEGQEARLMDLRAAVLELRRSKSMLAETNDENGRSAGSFFLNPVVAATAADAVRETYLARGGQREMPAWPAGEGHTKLSAAWLIEEAGFPRGYTRGRAGISSRHSLAIVNRGGASAAEILNLAREISERVHAVFAVQLKPEPILLGFDRAEIP